MNTHRIFYTDSEYLDYVHGLALPVFIHNSGIYFLETLDVYEDGNIGCWELISIDELEEQFDKN